MAANGEAREEVRRGCTGIILVKLAKGKLVNSYSAWCRIQCCVRNVSQRKVREGEASDEEMDKTRR